MALNSWVPSLTNRRGLCGGQNGKGPSPSTYLGFPSVSFHTLVSRVEE